METIFKYKFRTWLAELAPKKTTELKKEVAKEMGVEIRTVGNWLTMPIDAAHDVPFTAVLYICQSLGKSVEEARNYLPGKELKAPKLMANTTATRRRAFGLR